MIMNAEPSCVIFAPSVVGMNQTYNLLLEQVKRNDPAAVAKVYDQHASALFAFAKRLTGEEMVAEDLVHEVFVALPQAIGRFQQKASLRTFLFSIAANHARHYVRSATRRRAAMERFAQEPNVATKTPEQQSIQQNLAQTLTLALDTLPIDQRVAFVLCEVEERTSREAADIVGVPEATIRTRLFHAKQKLRKELERRGLS